MLASEQKKALSQLLDEAKASKQRRLLIIAGEQLWGRQQLAAVDLQTYFTQQLVISDDDFITDNTAEHVSDDKLAGAHIKVLNRSKALQALGVNLDCLVYDAYSGLNPDAIAAVSGAVVGGGLMILLTPELDDWHNFLDPDYQRLLVHPYRPDQLEHLFIRRFVNSIKAAKATLIFSQKEGVIKTLHQAIQATSASEALENDYCQTLDQRLAVDAIIKVLKGHRRRPLVLSSDRGRGKSSALGIAAAELINAGFTNIIITAPRLASVQTVFDHAKHMLKDSQLEGGKLHFQDQQLCFWAPDQLLRQLPSTELLLIDEAAAIPLSMLEALLKHYSRIVFSSTIHGYEGSGRGFGLRFQQLLDKQAPQWKKIVLQQPIRWQHHDPVEEWMFDALLLNAEYTVESPQTVIAADCNIVEINRRDLLQNEKRLRQIFSLLVIAHYQTTPADLRNLLDGPNIRIWCVIHDDNVLATALVTDEGCFDKKLSAAIWKGERRLRGHMLPQTLAAHSGVEFAPKLRYQRIMRIAVNPQMQQRGFGLALLSAISDKARKTGVDILGSSFAVTVDVLHFWQRGGYSPVRLGVSRDACSGSHSALVLKSFTLSGELVLDTVRYRFLEHFPHQLLTLFSQLEPDLVAGLMLGNDIPDMIFIDEQDWLDITAFAEGYRVYEVCTVPLWKLACSFMGQLEVRQWLSDEQRDLLIYLLLQNRPMVWVAKQLKLSGRKELIAALRVAVKLLSKQQTFLRPTSIH